MASLAQFRKRCFEIAGMHHPCKVCMQRSKSVLLSHPSIPYHLHQVPLLCKCIACDSMGHMKYRDTCHCTCWRDTQSLPETKVHLLISLFMSFCPVDQHCCCLQGCQEGYHQDGEVTAFVSEVYLRTSQAHASGMKVKSKRSCCQ
jgi:hypothetical protein